MTSGTSHHFLPGAEGASGPARAGRRPTSRRLGLLATAMLCTLALAPRESAARDGEASGMSLDTRPFQGLPRSVVGVNDLAYVGLDTGIAIYDVSDASTPLLVSHLDLRSPAFDVAVEGGVAFVANGESGLAMIDVANPASPRLLGRLPTPGTRAVAVQAGIAYLGEASDRATGIFGLRTVDVAQPALPVELGFVALANGALDVVVAGSTAYVAIGSEIASPRHGLSIVDVSNPALPVESGFLETGLAANGVALEGGVACIATGYPLVGALVTADVSNPAAPGMLDRMPLGDAAMGVSITSGIAHVAARALGIVAIDIADPGAPFQVDAMPTGRETWSIDAHGDVAFVAERSSSGAAGFTTVATPPPPECMSELSSTPFAEAMDLANLPGAAFLLRRDGLSIFGTSRPGPPDLLATWSPPGADLSVLAVQGDLAAAGDGALVRLADVSDLANPVDRGTIRLDSGVVVDLALDGDTLFVVDGSGLATFDVTDPSRPAPLGAYRATEWCAAVALSADLAFLACGDELQVLDVAAPSSPALAASLPIGVPLYDVAASGSLVTLTGLGDGLDVVDVSTPTSPSLVASMSADEGFGVSMQGTQAYLALGEAGVAVVDLSNPLVPVVVGTYDTSGTAVSVAASGTSVMVATVDAQHWALHCDACSAGCLATADVQPANPSLCEGETVQLDGSGSSVPGCGGALEYQWSEDGVPIPGATQATLDVPAAHASGSYRFTLDVSCASLPGCSAQASTDVSIAADSFPVVVVDSLRVHKGAGVEVLSWQIASGSGGTNIHRALVAPLLTDSAIDDATIVDVSPTTSYDNSFALPGPGVIFFKVFGRRSCTGASEVP